MTNPRPGSSFFLKLFKETYIGKINFTKAPEVKKVNNDRNTDERECKKKSRVNKTDVHSAAYAIDYIIISDKDNDWGAYIRYQQ